MIHLVQGYTTGGVVAAGETLAAQQCVNAVPCPEGVQTLGISNCGEAGTTTFKLIGV